MNIEAVVDEEMLKVGYVISEQYTLKKLWEDIKDIFNVISLIWRQNRPIITYQQFFIMCKQSNFFFSLGVFWSFY